MAGVAPMIGGENGGEFHISRFEISKGKSCGDRLSPPRLSGGRLLVESAAGPQVWMSVACLDIHGLARTLA